MEWTLYVCDECGDHALAAEELLHLPSQRCPGRREPERHVRPVLVAPVEARPAKSLAALRFLDQRP